MKNHDKPFAPSSFNAIDVGSQCWLGHIDACHLSAQCCVKIFDLHGQWVVLAVIWSAGALRAGGIIVLFELNAARLDWAFPSPDLGGEKLREIFRRATIRRNHIAPYLFETLLDGRLVERGDGSLVELLHDRWRRGGGKEERIPAWGIEVRQPLLVGGL